MGIIVPIFLMMNLVIEFKVAICFLNPIPEVIAPIVVVGNPGLKFKVVALACPVGVIIPD